MENEESFFFFFFPIKPGESEIETTAKRTKQIKSNIFALGFLLKRVRTEAIGWEGPTDCGIREGGRGGGRGSWLTGLVCLLLI